MPLEKIFLTEPYLKNLTSNISHITADGFYLDKTIFYATSGGQANDIGTVNDHQLLDVVKDQNGEILHKVSPDVLASFTIGQAITACLDWPRRYNHMRFHTALHLMCALVKDGSVTGCAIAADKARVDFNVDAGIYTPEQLSQDLNTLINGDHAIRYTHITEAELVANPNLVRSLSVQPPKGSGYIRMVTIGSPETPIDRQPCGGTHVQNTSEIGKITVQKIENKGKQNRRFHLSFST